MKKHREHICLMLAKLRKFDIQVDLNKYKFYMTKISLITSIEGIKIDSAKIKAIRQ